MLYLTLLNKTFRFMILLVPTGSTCFNKGMSGMKVFVVTPAVHNVTGASLPHRQVTLYLCVLQHVLPA